MRSIKGIKSICFVLIFTLIITMSVPVTSFAGETGSVVNVSDSTGLTEAVASAEAGAIIQIQQDITLNKSLEIPSDADFTLKGKTGNEKIIIALNSYETAQKSDSMAMVSVSGTVILEDLILDGQGNLRVMYIGAGGNVTMNDGAVITGGTLGKESINWGAGVRLQGSRSQKATLTINDGAVIKECTAYGDACITGIGVCIYRYGDVVMNGGAITNSQDKTEGSSRFFSYGGGLALLGADSTFTMNGGEISSCYAKAAGGGLYINTGIESFIMNGGSIRNNRTTAAGGGVYISGASVVMNGGSIENNISESDTNHGHYATGGGVYIAGGSENDGSTSGSLGTFYLNGGSIKNNTAKTTAKDNTYDAQFGQGGGVMIAGKLIMSGGNITGNTATSTYDLSGAAACGGGISIKGGAYAGSFIMNGGSITGNKAKNKGGAVYFNDKDLEENLLSASLSSMVPTPGIGTFNVQGNVIIKGNTTLNGSADNIYLQEEACLTISDELGNNAELYIEIENCKEGTIIAKSADEYSVSATDARKFTSNSGDRVYGVNNEKIVYTSKTVDTYQDISDAVVSGIESTYAYTGTAIKPEPVVQLDGVTLERGIDYTVSYKVAGYDNTNISDDTKLGVVKITGAGEYEGSIIKTFKITARNIADVSVDSITERIYVEGVAVEPKIHAVSDGMTLKEGIDYTISYSDNTHLGTATVTITGIGNYEGNVTKHFNIISSEGLDLIHNEGELRAAIETSEGTEDVPDKLYIMNNIDISSTIVIPENKHVHIVGNGDDISLISTNILSNLINVNGSMIIESLTLNANQKGRCMLIGKSGSVKTMADTVITGGLFGYGSSNIDYSGSGIFNNGVLNISAGEIYGNQAKNGAAIFNNGTMTATNVLICDNAALMSGGAVYNQGTATFGEGVVISGNTADTTAAYSVGVGGAGGGIYNSGILVCCDGCVIQDNQADYMGGGIYTEKETAISNTHITNNKTAGSGTERINNCGGGVFVAAGKFQMDSGSITKNIAKSTYVAKKPNGSLGNGGGVFVANDKSGTEFIMNGGQISNNQAYSLIDSVYSGNGGGVFVMGGDYHEDPDNEVSPGRIIINGGSITENSASSRGDGVYMSNEEYFLSNKTYMDFKGASSITIGGLVNVNDNGADDLYLRKNIVIDLINSIAGGKVGVSAETGGTAIVAKGNGYVPSMEDAAAFVGKSGSRTIQFNNEKIVLQAMDIGEEYSATLDENSYLYTGSEIKPDVRVVAADGRTLAEGKDYTVSYEGTGTVGKKLINTGTKKVIVYGEGDYTGSITSTYEIIPRDISEVKASIEDIAYTGSALKPAMKSITYNGTTLLRGTDYESVIGYSDNIKAGKATATITGKGNYTGTKEVTFNILPRSITEITVAAINNKVYTGKFIKPTPVVKDGTKKLVLNRDYTISYKNNKKTGKGTVVIKGKGNYSGTKTTTFKIIPKKAVVKSVKCPKKSRITVTIKKDLQASGYQIMIAQNKKFTKGKKTVVLNKNSKVTTTFKGLKSKKTYYVKVRSYKTINGVKYYGAYSLVKKIKVK